MKASLSPSILYCPDWSYSFVAGSLLGWGRKGQYSPDGEDLQKKRKKRTKKKAKSSFSRGNVTKVEFLVTTFWEASAAKWKWVYLQDLKGTIKIHCQSVIQVSSEGRPRAPYLTVDPLRTQPLMVVPAPGTFFRLAIFSNICHWTLNSANNAMAPISLQSEYEYQTRYVYSRSFVSLTTAQQGTRADLYPKMRRGYSWTWGDKIR